MSYFDIYLKINDLPLNVRKHVLSYNHDIIDYIHIRYTLIKLRTHIIQISGTDYNPSLYNILKLICSIRHFFTSDGDTCTTTITNYTSRDVSQLLTTFRYIVPWNNYTPYEYPWSLDVFIAIVSCGYSCIDRTNYNIIEWKFKISLLRRFNFSLQCHHYLSI